MRDSHIVSGKPHFSWERENEIVTPIREKKERELEERRGGLEKKKHWIILSEVSPRQAWGPHGAKNIQTLS